MCLTSDFQGDAICFSCGQRPVARTPFDLIANNVDYSCHNCPISCRNLPGNETTGPAVSKTDPDGRHGVTWMRRDVVLSNFVVQASCTPKIKARDQSELYCSVWGLYCRLVSAARSTADMGGYPSAAAGSHDKPIIATVRD